MDHVYQLLDVSGVFLRSMAKEDINLDVLNQLLHDLLSIMCTMFEVSTKENDTTLPRAQAQTLQFFPQSFDEFLHFMTPKSLGYVTTV